MIVPPGGVRVLVATRPVDFRKGMDGLAAVAKETLAQDPFSGTIVVFRAKRADRVKLLFWDGSGLLLVSKRLEQGRRRGEHDLKDRDIRRQQLGHQRQIREGSMRERVRVVNRKDDARPRIRGQQLCRHHLRSRFMPDRDASGRDDHLLQLRRLGQWRSDVKHLGGGADARSQRGFGHPR